MIVSLLDALSEGLGLELKFFMLPLDRFVVLHLDGVSRFLLGALGCEHLLHQLHFLLRLFKKQISLFKYGLLFFDKGVLLFDLACEFRIVIVQHEFAITEKADSAMLHSKRIVRLLRIKMFRRWQVCIFASKYPKV